MVKRYVRTLRRETTLNRLSIAAFFLILGLGTLGFEQGRAEPQIIDSVYRALQLFAIAFEPPDTPWEMNLLVQAARFLAPLMLVITVLTALSRDANERAGLFLQRNFAKKRCVLLGFGPINRAYARRLDEDDYAITAVARDVTAGDRAFARDHGVLLVAGDLSDRATLRRAALHKAERVYVACGDDATNLESASLAADVCEGKLRETSACSGDGTMRGYGCDAMGNVIVRVHIGSYGRMLAMNDSLDHTAMATGGYRAFSSFGEAALQLVQRARFAERARDLGDQRVHVAIVGLGDLGEAVLVETLLNVIDPDRPPIITLIDRDKEAAKQRFETFYPRLFDRSLPDEAQPEIRFEHGTALDVAAEKTDCGEGLERAAHPPTAWVFTCPEDETNSTAAFLLERAMMRLARRPVPIYARVWDRLPIVTSGERTGMHMGERQAGRLTTTFGDVWTTIHRGRKLREEIETRAQAIHAHYLDDKRKRFFGEDPHAFTMHWNALPENARRGNRTAARHLVQKLQALGFDWRGRGEGMLPRITRDDPIHAALQGPFQNGIEDQALRAVARTEHCRWMIERALSGWRGVETRARRNNRKRLHDNMVAFDALAAHEHGLDLTALIVAMKADGAEAPTAYRRRVHAIGLNDLKLPGETPDAAAVTELDLTVYGHDQTMSSIERRFLLDLLQAWAGSPALSRVHVRVIGERDLKMTAPAAPIGEDWGPFFTMTYDRPEEASEPAHPNLGIARWLDEIAQVMPEDMLFDVSYRAR
ncbi:MAG: NAD-binding protein [Pseudomonadota bacterium]